MKILIALLILLSFNLQAGEIYNTDIELSPTVLAKWSSPYDLTVLYSIGPLNLKAGDIVDLRLQAEFTNDCAKERSNSANMYNIGLGRYIVRTDSQYGTSGHKAVKGSMQNITANMHHGVISHSGLDHINYDVDGVYYNVVVYAASSTNQCAGYYMTVEGYGTNSYGQFTLEVR